MAFSRISYTRSAWAASNSATAAPSVTSGNLIVVICHAIANSAFNVSDSQGNTYLAASASGTGPIAGETRRIYATKATATGTNTVTVGATGASYSGIEVYEISGEHATTYVDDANGLVNAAASGSLTTTVNNCLIIATCVYTGGYPDVGSGYTKEADFTTGWYNTTEYLLDAGAAGSKTVSFANGGGLVAAAFRPAASGGSTPTLTTISPSDGFIGTADGACIQAVTLTGTNLGGSTPSITISGSNVTASSIVQVNSTTWTANLTITSSAAQTVRTVSVTTSDGTSNTVNFTVRARTGGGSTIGTGPVGRGASWLQAWEIRK